MPIPDFQALMLPLLRMAADDTVHASSEAFDRLADVFRLTAEERNELLPSGRQTRLANRVGWAATYLRKARLLQPAGRGAFKITDRGRELLSANPSAIDVKFLQEHCPDVADFIGAGKERHESAFDPGTLAWSLREDVFARIKGKFESSMPDPTVRGQAMELLARAIENADEERCDAWYVKESPTGIRLVAGRVVALRVSKPGITISVVGPVAEDVRARLQAEIDDDVEFKAIPGAMVLRFPAQNSGIAWELLHDAFDDFVDAAMARVRQPPGLEAHVPEAVQHVASIVGRELPQPEIEPQRDEEDSDGSEEPESIEARAPRARGRAPIFELGQRSISSLLEEIRRELVALPDLQRPFVWEDTKVRDLLDSLFLGFPVGTLVLWYSGSEKEARAVGADSSGLRATTLVIDGQQRLTSLHAVMSNAPVIDKTGVSRSITIAFRPRDGRFEVADAAIRNDPEFIPSVTELWTGGRTKQEIRRALMTRLQDAGRVVDQAYQDAVESNLERAQMIQDYRFPTVEIRKTSVAPSEDSIEEDVAEIFVRINNQGTRLGQADFVLTLLSVFSGPLRDRIEARARAMSDESYVAVDAQQLLRASCAVAFGRARMSAIYKYLRGLDPVSRDADLAARKQRLADLDRAASDCMDSTTWRDFVLRACHAGFVHPSLIASRAAAVNAFAIYVRGKRMGVPRALLDAVISRWLFGTLVTARYSSSSETAFESDLSRLNDSEASDSESFIRSIDEMLASELTADFWTQGLVASLDTQRSRAPSALAFKAAQVVLGARALFSDQAMQQFLTAGGGSRAASEAHHLFPKAYLTSRRITARRLVNNVANLATVAWASNSDIGSQPPSRYVPRLREQLRIDDPSWGRACAEHALPPAWEAMEYDEFLLQRRRRMADIMRIAYRKMGGEADAPPLSPPWFLPGQESTWRRIAEAERRLREIVRQEHDKAFGKDAARRIESSLGERERQSLQSALRSRPPGADPLSVIDYLYLGQLLPLLFTEPIWGSFRKRLGDGADVRKKLQSSLEAILPVRNEIAHVREVAEDRLLRADLACRDLLSTLSRD